MAYNVVKSNSGFLKLFHRFPESAYRRLLNKVENEHLSVVPVWSVNAEKGEPLNVVSIGLMLGSAISLVGIKSVSLNARVSLVLDTTLDSRRGPHCVSGLDPEIYRALVLGGRQIAHRTWKGLNGPYQQLQPLMEKSHFSCGP